MSLTKINPNQINGLVEFQKKVEEKIKELEEKIANLEKK